MRLGSHYVPLRVLVGWLVGFLVLFFEILGLPTCTRKTQYTTGLPVQTFYGAVMQRRVSKGRRGSGGCLGASRGSVLGSASQGADPLLQQGRAVACAERLPREARLKLREQGFSQWLLTGA